ncbi:MAG: hypothetical protein P8R42_30450 [Candidatus Binatia bacterium]|nr:hypothetical protein [Candidatus Binatia bacterium]
MGLAARRALEGRIVILNGAALFAHPGDLLDKLKILSLGLGDFAVELPEAQQSAVPREGRQKQGQGDRAEQQSGAAVARLRE